MGDTAGGGGHDDHRRVGGSSGFADVANSGMASIKATTHSGVLIVERSHQHADGGTRWPGKVMRSAPADDS